METYLSKLFKITPEQVSELKGNTSDIEFLNCLINQHEPPQGIPYYIFKKSKQELEAEIIRIKLRPWAIKNNIEKIINELSLLELKATCNYNPYYLLYAFGVSYEICFQLLNETGISTSLEIAAHAKLWSMLLENPVIFVNDAHTTLRDQYYMDIVTDLSMVEIFPKELLNNHPLLSYDPYTESAGTLRYKITIPGTILSCIRERKFLENRIYVSRGRYMIHDSSKQFVDALNGIYSRAKKLQKTIQKSYKELKE
jgi:hypothetical protein